MKLNSKTILPVCILLPLFFMSLLLGCKSTNNGNVTNWNDSTNTHSKPLQVDNNIVAHRGAYRIHGAPGNSLAAFQDAIDLHLYAIECDIQLTKDNKLIVYHDLSFKGLKIATSTYSELKSAGKLPNGEELPLFRDFLKKALDGKYTRIWVDVKAIPKNFGGDVRSAKACITAMNIARELKAENFIAGFLIRKTFIMQRAAVASKNEFNLAYQSSKAPSYYESRGYTWASQPYGVFYPNNAEKLEKFHDLGIKVKAYELDHVYNVTWFIKHNVDMFGTNYPKMALGVLDSLKNR